MNSVLLDTLKIKKKPREKKDVILNFMKKEVTNIPRTDDNGDNGDNGDTFIKPDTSSLTKPNVEVVNMIDKTDFDSTNFLQNIRNRGKQTKQVVDTLYKETLPKQPQQDLQKPSSIQVIRKRKVKKIKIKPSLKGTISKFDDDTKKPIIDKPDTMLFMKDFISNRINKPDNKQIIASSYYLNNREKYIGFINALFLPYKQQIEQDEKTLSCESRKGEFSLLTHQKIVRDYINNYTPYRGALLYHGLGSGKTCSSIAIAEGLKTTKEIIVMTPASLRMNYIEELKMCGDLLYKKNQYWEFIDTTSKPELNIVLSKALNIDIDFVVKNKGAWFVNMNKSSNYNELGPDQKELLNNQINMMIASKYKFINYNGLRLSHLNKISMDGSINPFDNKVIVIDEVHNLISRIVNKLNKTDSLAYRLYKYLMEAQNARIVLLSGTPIINYPNELAIIYNILRGYIKTYTIQITPNTTQKIDINYFKTILNSSGIVDYIDYKPSNKQLTITQNPFGFVNTNKPGKVKINLKGKINTTKFISNIFNILKTNNIEYNSKYTLTKSKALPDNMDEFKNLFINEDYTIKNDNLLKRRIVGLTSYLSDMDSLLPKYDIYKNFHEEKIYMSDYQFSIYEMFRQSERKEESRNAKKSKSNISSLYQETASTYRIFSRLACNFVFPEEYKRPMPSDTTNIDENAIDNTNPDNLFDEEIDKIIDKTTDKLISYKDNILKTIQYIDQNKQRLFTDENLKLLSPKFLRIIENIRKSMSNPDTDRLHLLYSQFRTLEGIGIMKFVLEANGFAQFKIKKNSNGLWLIDIAPQDKGKPTFILYTGTETPEEKEILRNIFNSTWGSLPTSLVNELKEISSNNFYGEIIKLIMITSSGAEGISLRNVCYVHLMESYWHPVRLEQVIGRARRICSHEDLPIDKRTVDVYLYLMTFTDTQKNSDGSIELRLKDVSKFDNKTPVTSDEALYEISTIKSQINKNLLSSVKESSFDCALHVSNNTKEGLVCYNFGSTTNNAYSYKPSYLNEDTDKVGDINRTKITWKGKTFKLAGVKYVLRPDNNEVYDYDSYILSTKNPSNNPILIGILERSNGRAKILPV
jgi:isopentenyldiphosphate isomerase